MKKTRRRNYVSIDVEVDIDISEHLGDAHTDDLIDELKNRDLDKEDMVSLHSLIGSNKPYRKSTLADELRMELIMSNQNNKSIEELEEFFKQ